MVPILRAGLGLVDGVLRMVPSARVGHIGMFRDEETLEPHVYFCKMPKDVAERDIIIVDPMLATGGSADAAITEMKKRGCKQHQAHGAGRRPRGHRAPAARSTPTWTSTPARWTTTSTSTATSFPVWAMPATVSSAPSNRVPSAYLKRLFFSDNQWK